MFGDDIAVIPRQRPVHWEYRLPSHADSIGEARHRARTALEPHTDEETLDSLELVVSELVTNAVRHGPGTPITLRLVAEVDGAITGVVEDRGSGAGAFGEENEVGLEGGLGG